MRLVLLAVVSFCLSAIVSLPGGAEPAAGAVTASVAVPGRPGADALGLRERIASFVGENGPVADLEIDVPPLQRFRVKAPAERVRIQLEPERQTRSDRMPIRVSLWDRQSRRLLKRGVVQVGISGERPVVVTRKAVRAGARLDRADLEMEMRSLSELRNGFVEDPERLFGQRLKRGLARGSVLQPGFVEEPPLVERGQRVKIRVASGGLRIEMSGRAQQEGRAGDWIRAINDRSNQEIVGRVGRDGVLNVDL